MNREELAKVIMTSYLRGMGVDPELVLGASGRHYTSDRRQVWESIADGVLEYLQDNGVDVGEPLRFVGTDAATARIAELKARREAHGQ